MAGNTLNLSLLSRGIGEVNREGHEKVEIRLEPEDYFNLKSDQLYLPPLSSSRSLSVRRPSLAASSTPGRAHSASTSTATEEVHLPKTFTTRRGALLLFSEDLAGKKGTSDDGSGCRRGLDRSQHLSRSVDDLSLRTFGDLAASILSYGGSSDRDKIHLRFVRDRAPTTKRVRPGFSARRYLSRLTRSFDDSFLEKLMSKGYVQEKTLFQSNALVPHLRRRINDDLSSLPPPYRILKNMLMAPGLLSGYNFFRTKSQDNASELSIVIEEEEDVQSRSRRHRGLKRENSSIVVVDLREGAPRSVVYSELDQEEKENVLTDLLVKSAINHALEKQRKKMFEDSLSVVETMSNDDQTSLAPSNGVVGSQKVASPQATPRTMHFDMAEAVRSYLESAVDASVVTEPAPSTKSTLKGRKLSSHSGKSFEAHQRIPEYRGEREYVGDIPVVSFKEPLGSTTSSRRSSLGDIRGAPTTTTNLPPIQDVNETISRGATQDQIMNKTVVLPPIGIPSNQAPHQTHFIPGSASEYSEFELPPLPRPSVMVEPPTPQRTFVNGDQSHHHGVETTRVNVSDEEDESESSDVEMEGEGYQSRRSSPAPLRSEEDDIHMTDSGEQNVFPPKWEASPRGTRHLRTSGKDSDTDDASVTDSHSPRLRKKKLRKQLSQNSLVSTISLDSGAMSLKAGSAVSLSGSAENLTFDLGGSGPNSATTAGGGMRGGALTSTRRKQRSNRSTAKSEKKVDVGSTVLGPDGNVVQVGGGIGPRPDESLDPISALSAANQASSDMESGSEVYHHNSDSNMVYTDVTLPVDEESVKDMVPANGQAPVSEKELVQALTEHAHKIAQSVLAGDGTGENLIRDAEAAASLWVDKGSAQTLTRSQSVQRMHALEGVAGSEMQKRASRSANPSVAQYRDMLRNTLINVMSKQQEGSSIPTDVEISPDLIQALVQQQLGPNDIEMRIDENGRTVIRAKSPGSIRRLPNGSRKGSSVTQQMGGVKEGHIFHEPKRETLSHAVEAGSRSQTPAGPPRSIPADRAAVTGDLGMEIINYGEAEKPQSEATPGEEEEHEGDQLDVTPPSESPGVKVPSAKSQVTFIQEDEEIIIPPAEEVDTSEQETDKPEESLDEPEPPRPDTVKSTKSAKSLASGKKSKSSLDDREEFVVGKVPDQTELKLYAPVEPPPPAKDLPKKPRVPPAPKVKPPAKKSDAKKAEVKKGGKGAKKGGKKGVKKKEAQVAPPVEEPPEPAKEPTPAPPVEAPVEEEPVKAPSPAPSDETYVMSPTPEPEEEEEMEFVIIRDVSSESEPEPEPEPEVLPVVKSAKSSIAPSETEEEETEVDSDDDEEKIKLKQITARDARAAKRAAQAAKRREEVDRKRREKEEQIRKEKEEQERKEKIQQELDEERKKREESKRLERLRRDEERRQADQEEAERLRRQQQEAERERRMKEEYQRRLEEVKKKALEEEMRRKEIEEEKKKEEEELRKEEEARMALMEEEERKEYERRKKEEEERRKREEEEARIKREEELKRQMEEAKRFAEEMARRQAELEKRLKFNRGLKLESHGLGHTQDVTRAFVFSYYELLQWLGLEVPDFMKMKENMPF